VWPAMRRSAWRRGWLKSRNWRRWWRKTTEDGGDKVGGEPVWQSCVPEHKKSSLCGVFCWSLV
jgi:hypothetical protein